ncbi:MAG: hypothetical protein ACI8RD_004392 [Bacillariaceae sp.]|jgi:hypothetical protein
MSKDEIKNKKVAQASKKRKNPGPGILRNGGSARSKSNGTGDGSGNASATSSARTSAIDEFDALFSDKKKQDKQTKKEEAVEEAAIKAAKKARRKNDGPSSSSSSSTSFRGEDWVDDGLGGKFNKEGYTGRVEDGIKIFKAHILNKPKSGQTNDCPFDCDCCFI